MCQAIVRRNCRVVSRQGVPVGPARDNRFSIGPEQSVEVVAEGVELAHDLGGDVGFGAAL